MWIITFFSFVHHILCFEGCPMQFCGLCRQCVCNILVDRCTYCLVEVSFRRSNHNFGLVQWYTISYMYAEWKKNNLKPMPIKSILEKMIQNRARKQQQDRAGEDGRRPGEPILFQVGQRWLLVVVVIFWGWWWSGQRPNKKRDSSLQHQALWRSGSWLLGSWWRYSLPIWAN